MQKGKNWVIKGDGEFFLPSPELKKIAWVSDESIYEKADKDPLSFWAERAREGLEWFKEWNKIYEWNPPYFKWFIGGKLNICYNAVDRHIKTWRKNKAAIIWEPEPPEERIRVLTYNDLYREVNKFANVLKTLGVKKGDRVGIYMPIIPEVQIAMLACTRIGAVHSVVFSAFSSESLKSRLIDAEAKVLVTVDGYHRRGKIINLKASADEGVKDTAVEKVIVVKRAGLNAEMKKGQDFWWHELMEKADSYCEPEVMDSEDPSFILYTSGTTGKPKGIVHHTGGYAAQAYWTTKWDFDLHDEDILWCTADIGWITGHTYACYGPLLCGATMVTYEGAPDYPAPDRFWQIIEKYGVTIFYTAPTAIRMFMMFGEEWVKKHDLSSLRILGTVGEPIDRDAWMWYFNNIGGGRCPIIDTWWQTETGGTLINALPGIGPFIPTVAGRPFPGVKREILDDEGKSSKEGNLVICNPFPPGMLRGIFKDPKRYKEQYWNRFGDNYYTTGDGAKIVDEMGNTRITGRVDDVMKVAGHRLANAEVEDALNRHEAVIESAVVAAPDPIKGEVPIAFVVLEKGYNPSDELTNQLIKQVEHIIGPTARPKKIIYVSDLPKTRSGKIMRRIIKKLITKEPVGDITTLMNPESVEELRKIIETTYI
jgi:acetyl-CoA synthetase